MTIVPDDNALAAAVAGVEDAAAQLFRSDPRIHSVGVGVDENGRPTYRAVRNVKKIVAFHGATRGFSGATPFPVVFVDAAHDATPLLRVPSPSSPVSAAAGEAIPEQQHHRPLCCGLQIQNFDDDDREGEIAQGVMIVGSIGYFVKKNGAGTYILSNNHVVAGENRGQVGDRILQPGGTAVQPNLLAARLSDFVSLQFSPAGASVAAGNVIFNDVDAGLAEVENGTQWSNTFLPGRTGIKSPSAFGRADRDDQVSKVGRTTGLTTGMVTAVATIVGPVGYGSNEAWFRGSIEISSLNGIQFSDHGDSGSAIINSRGEVVALLYAGNGQQTYACPIDGVVSALGISL